MRPNLHFPRELLPPKSVKRSRSGSSEGRRAAKQHASPARRRLVHGSEGVGMSDEQGRFADPLEADIGSEPEEGEEGASGPDDDEEEVGEAAEPQDYAEDAGGYEDGLDDDDSGGDDEPTY